ncbi:MAG: peptide/nickel transport system permease protein [Solirubrobacteraceae bacterium]|jgi:peptide/nickel transport system permease protein|nr:peptide/nickel transport system permease protein [Solirubrobacteraceae bacterium]MEA2359520.1 peptide/nickel transport system permease protein [Solirubrobacteraceae bacterium]
MLTFIIRRLLWMVVLLLVISFLTYVIFYTLPAADPAALRAGRQPTPELLKSIRETLGLDKPWYVQYGKYLQRLVFHFDFGFSYQNNVSVKSQIFDRLPATATLAAGGAVVWLLVGIPVGIVSAIKRGQWMDRLAMGSALVAISAPVYWLGLVSLYLFSKDLGKFPLFEGQGAYPNTGTLFTNPGAVIPAMILPWCVLAASFAAVYARFLRGNLLETMSEDYIRTARAKGLRERVVVFKHGVRSAITPIVTILGLDLGILLGGAILTETVFNIPGVGRLAFDSIQKSDLPTVQGTVLMGAFFIILLNLVVDVVYAFLDPRVRY